MPLFEVPIVPPELNQDDMILQIADSLDYLSAVVSATFNCIKESVDQKHERLMHLSSRMDKAKVKIDKLTGSKSATKVFSPAKFPAANAYRTIHSVFANLDELLPPVRVEVGVPRISKETQKTEKLQFFHVRNKARLLKKNLDVAPRDGLGPVPSNLKSVTSLLLFNTAESPYKNYVTLDPMKGAAKVKNDESEIGEKHLDAAPHSIALGEQISIPTQESYLYSPSLGDVPGLDVPIDLPNLPGIADDLRFNVDHGSGFAPSVVSAPAIPDLPAITPDMPATDLLQEKSNGIVPTTQTSPAMPPPPPPPPPPAPPRPPPPPLEAPLTTERMEPKPTPKPIPVSDDGRASLMEAIRRAGGSTNAKLRSVRENQDEVRRKKEEKAIAAGGDLMADLHNRLLMRRRGISGDKSGAGSAMERISAMIPPPSNQHDTSSATEEEDWE